MPLLCFCSGVDTFSNKLADVDVSHVINGRDKDETLTVYYAGLGGWHESSVQEFAPQFGFNFECPPVDSVAVLAGV